MEQQKQKKSLEQQADEDRKAAVERNKPVQDLLETMFYRQFDRVFTKEKQK